MKIKKYITLFFSVMVVVILSCQQESKLPLPFDTLNNLNGAYLRQLSITSGFFNYFGLDTSTFKLNVEESDGQYGGLFSSVDVFVAYTSASGTKVVEQLLKNYPASGFTKFATTGLPRATLTMTFTETIAKLGIAKASIQPTDNFTFRFAVNLKDGRVFSSTNASGNLLTGPFYNSPFLNNVGVGCPSNIPVGNYTSSQDDASIWFGGPNPLPTTKTVTITKKSANTYLISDVSAGGYQACCASLGYNVDQPALVTDICNQISVTSSSAQIAAKQGSLVGTWNPTTNTMVVYYIDSFNASPTLKSTFVKQ